MKRFMRQELDKRAGKSYKILNFRLACLPGKFVICTKYELHRAMFPGMPGGFGKLARAAGSVWPSSSAYRAAGRGNSAPLSGGVAPLCKFSIKRPRPAPDRPELRLRLGSIRGRGDGPYPLADCDNSQ